MKNLTGILAAMFAVAGAGTATAKDESVLRATVLKVSERPSLVAGYIGAWIEISTSPDGGRTTSDLYLLYGSEQQSVPGAGRLCSFRYHLGIVSGAIGSQPGRKEGVKIIDHFDCEPAQSASR
jgi:hypothetical protein